MFERYTTKARRVISRARYEVSQSGASAIETEHLLLGLLREDEALIAHFFPKPSSMRLIRQQIEERAVSGKKILTSVEVPLSNESQKVLTYAAEEAERKLRQQIGPEHLLLGLLREENSLAAQILYENGLRLRNVREGLWGGIGSE
jgi:ATP-dependent Clp protease ATP-binding subunit ClpC